MTTNSIKSIHKGDVLLVDFKKNEGSEQNGIRPAIVVQNDTGNVFSPTTIVCPLTSREKGMDATHIVLTPEDCGILQSSIVLCEQIRVIDKSRIRRKVGRIVEPSKIEAIEQMAKVLSTFLRESSDGGQRSLGLMLMETNGGKSGRTKNTQKLKQNLPNSKSNSCYSE